MAGCLSGIAKYILFFFNFLIVLCGILFIALGAILLVNEDNGVNAFTEYSIGGFAIAIGVIIFIVAFLGCCGAIKENSCMLITYAVVLIILLILQVVLGALAFVAVKNDDRQFSETVRNETLLIYNKYYTDGKTNKDVINNIQETFECCGVDRPDDFGQHGLKIPVSCCGGKETCDKDNAYQRGCAAALSEILENGAKVIGGIAIGFAVIELVGAIFACVVKNRR